MKSLKRDFNTIYQRSLDKEELLKREIDSYSKIIYETKNQVQVQINDDDPFLDLEPPYSSMQIFLIQQFYKHFIVNGADITDLEEKEPLEFCTWIRDIYEAAFEYLAEPYGPKYYYLLTRDLYEYLKWLQKKMKDSVKSSNVDETIIGGIHLTLIFKKYGHYFENETLDSWLTRFSKLPVEIDPINVEPMAKAGTGRLALIAILESIQKTTWNAFDFKNFVFTHFGISNYQSTKTKSRTKDGYEEIVKECDRILRK